MTVDLPPSLITLARSAAADADPVAVFRAAEAASKALLGHRLFTTLFDLKQLQLLLTIEQAVGVIGLRDLLGLAPALLGIGFGQQRDAGQCQSQDQIVHRGFHQSVSLSQEWGQSRVKAPICQSVHCRGACWITSVLLQSPFENHFTHTNYIFIN